MAEKKPELLFLEAAEKRGSGWILQGTEDDVNPIELQAADRVWIPNTGYMAVEENGDIVHKPVRYISHDRSIDLEDQERRKVKYDKMDAKNDANKITMEKGVMTLIKTPSNKALTDYLEKVFWNLDAPNRPETATALYRVVRLDKKARTINENDMVLTEAKSLVYRLQSKKGSEWIFDENKIDSYCKVLDIVGGDSYDEKLYALRVHAEADPHHFVSLISSLDNTMNAEIGQAVEFKIINFENNVAQFADGDKIIKPLGDQKLTKKQQIEALADFLKTSEGTEHLTLIRAKVDEYKNKQLGNK